MDLTFTALDWSLWAADVVCGVLLLLLLLRTALYRRFAIYSSYLLFGLVRDLSFPIAVHYAHGQFYLQAYLTQTSLEYLFILAVFYELLKEVFGPLEILPPHTLKMFFATSMVMTIALGLIGVVFPSPRLGAVLTAIMYLHKGSTLLCAAILLMVLPFASMLGLRWRHYSFGIVLGLGLYSTVELVMSAVGSSIPIHLQPAVFKFIKYIPSFAYLLSMLIWTEYFRRPEPAREQVSVEVLNGLKGVSNQLEDLYTSPTGMVRRLMWQSSLQR